MKHTQGEWELSDVQKTSWGGVQREVIVHIESHHFKGVAVANVYDTDGEEGNANARLITAAPDLLEFAQEMVRRYPNSPWIFEQGNEVIKKATL